MTPDDEIPEHDPLAESTRRALGRLAETDPTDSLSWGAVHSRARRVKAMRMTTAIAACVVVLAGVGVVVGAANRDPDRVNVAGPSGDTTTTSEPASTTSSSAPTTTLPTTPATCLPAPCGTGPVGPPATTLTPAPPSAAPGPSDFTGSMALNGKSFTEMTIYVGDDIDIAATVTNITDHDILPADTRVLSQLATVCTSESSGRQFLWWMTNVPMAPGTRSGRSGTFTPTELDQGNVKCEVDVVIQGAGTVFETDAGGDDAKATIVAPVTAVAPVTITVVARSEATTTTLPTATTVPTDTTTTTSP